MDFALSYTSLAFKGEARRFLAARYPTTTVGDISDADGVDRDVWPCLRQLGWLDRECGPLDLAVITEECGRALLPAPWWVTAGAARAVFAAADVETDTPAVLADGGGSCHATRHGERWLLDGDLAAVLDAASVAEVIVPATGADGTALFLVDRADATVRWTPRDGIDPLRTQTDAELRRTPAVLLVDADRADGSLRTARRCSELLRACEAVGVADRALRFGLDHASTRSQFGRVIGSYQAVAHPLAEAYAELELARSLAYRAACTPLDDPGAADEAVACAVVGATAAAVLVCETAMQVCGGMGVTWEFPLHRWYRRALWYADYQAARPDPLDTVAAAVFA